MSTVASATLVMPFDPAGLPLEQRCEYLRTLWRADIDPFIFVGTARRLGYVISCRWDAAADMPELTAITVH